MAEANASSVIGGKEFGLRQFHFHTPSEHTVEGEHFPLEMHMVHQAEGTSSPPFLISFLGFWKGC
jgi:carbonic anhydrase